ncbi:MAG: replication initiator protein [Microviridae sp.]|nr:MAG: replication initiator protein [Microviridae sp.]
MCTCRLSVLNPAYRKAIKEGWMTPDEASQLPDYRISIPCGKCSECRRSFSLTWRSRLLAEYDDFCYQLGYSPFDPINRAPVYFYTLTVDESHRPDAESDPSRVLRLFHERYRAACHKSFRHWCTVEYGDPVLHTGRIHFHGVAFGLDCPFSKFRKLWGLGRVDISRVRERACMTYVSKYVTKFDRDRKRFPFAGKVFASAGIGTSLYLKNASAISDQLLSLTSVSVVYRNYRYPVPYYYARKILLRKHGESALRQRRIYNTILAFARRSIAFFGLTDRFTDFTIHENALLSLSDESFLSPACQRLRHIQKSIDSFIGETVFTYTEKIKQHLKLLNDYVFDYLRPTCSVSRIECALRACI